MHAMITTSINHFIEDLKSRVNFSFIFFSINADWEWDQLDLVYYGPSRKINTLHSLLQILNVYTCRNKTTVVCLSTARVFTCRHLYSLDRVFSLVLFRMLDWPLYQLTVTLIFIQWTFIVVKYLRNTFKTLATLIAAGLRMRPTGLV